jgi:hypothetical protein
MTRLNELAALQRDIPRYDRPSLSHCYAIDSGRYYMNRKQAFVSYDEQLE